MENLEFLNNNKDDICDFNFFFDKFENVRKNRIKLPLGVDNLDKILGGGFDSGSVYLVFGGNSTGKTQLCHQICVQGFKYFSNEQNKINQKSVLFFDSENTFRPERIKELSGFHDIDYKEILKNTLISNIRSNSILLLSLKNIEEDIKKNSIKIFIIDSINHHYRFEKGEKNFSFNNTKKDFLNILEKINHITKKYNIITIITAQVTPNFIDDAFIKEEPVALQYLNHFFSESIYLKQKKDKQCYAHLVNSLKLPEKRVLYEIGNKGIQDFKI